MQFFLHQIAARVLAAYLIVDIVRTLLIAVAERKITFYGTNSDWISWLLTRSKQTYYRDTMPIRYWLQFGTQVAAMGACVITVLFGWYVSDHP